MEPVHICRVNGAGTSLRFFFLELEAYIYWLIWVGGKRKERRIVLYCLQLKLVLITQGIGIGESANI